MPRSFFVLVCLFLLVFPASAAFAAPYSVKGDVAGEILFYRVQPGDTLYSIARSYGLGIVELRAANPGVDTWVPEVGRDIILPMAHVLPPGPREGIVLSLAQLRLYYFIDPRRVLTFPAGIGKEGWATPTGMTKIVKKRTDPVWIPPPSIRAENPDLPAVFPAGPDNPLGTHALNLGWPGYLIHGTNQPYGVGRRSSHGCIRLYPEDIPVLFDRVEVGTGVRIVNQPYHVGWQGNKLMLEVFTPLNAAAAGDLLHVLQRQAGGKVEIDRAAVLYAAQEASGVPAPVGRKTRWF